MNAAGITQALNSPINRENVPSEYLFEEIEEEKAGLFSKKALAEKGHVLQGDIAFHGWAFPNGVNSGWNSPSRGVSCRNGPASGHLDIGGGQGGLELVDPPGGPPSLVAPKADPPDPPRIIKFHPRRRCFLQGHPR